MLLNFASVIDNFSDFFSLRTRQGIPTELSNYNSNSFYNYDNSIIGVLGRRVHKTALITAKFPQEYISRKLCFPPEKKTLMNAVKLIMMITFFILLGIPFEMIYFYMRGYIFPLRKGFCCFSFKREIFVLRERTGH